MVLHVTIPGDPRTKKNHSQIFKTKAGVPFLAPSPQYEAYCRQCALHIPAYMRTKISNPINLRCVYYMQTRRKVDLANLLAATCDILVKYEVLEDDNSNIVATHDGSCVLYDKANPRAEIYIEDDSDEQE